MISRLNILLLLALVGSGLYLIQVQHDGRRLFTALSSETASQGELQAENKRLQLELQNLLRTAQIDQNARALMQMRPASLGVTQDVPKDAQALQTFVPQIPANVVLSNKGGTR